MLYLCFFFSSRRRHTRYWRDWSSDVCSSDLVASAFLGGGKIGREGTSSGSRLSNAESRRARPVSGSGAVPHTTTRDGSVIDRCTSATRRPSTEIAGSPVFHDRR